MIVWGIILIPKIVVRVYNRFVLKYEDYILGLKKEEYDKAVELFNKELLQATIIHIAIVAGLIILVNLVIYSCMHATNNY